jgi:glucose-6-phosphate 1-dehydrogenase
MTGRPAPVHTGELPVATPPRVAGPCTIVILGAAGDLARRKLLPSLLHLQGDGLLHDGVRVIGVGRPELSDSAFREEVRKALDPEPALWQRFAPRLSWIAGDLAMASTYQTIREQLELFEAAPGEPRGRLFYLAVPPSLYETVVQGLDRSDAVSWQDDPRDPRWTRVVIEKPFGRNLETARALNRVLAEVMAEHQIYRIDHYLGKETVQNLMVFRFANSIFEPVWNRHHIHHVQITAAETLGVEHRAGYYEEAGVVRDMFQNHLLQLLALSAMEPPVTSRADAVRDEKVKVLRAIRPIPESELTRYAVRGQYAAGSIEGSPVPGYRQEPGVAPGSRTPTYAAIRVMVDNWRWQGVPFYLRSGKRMARRDTEIAIQFREPPHLMFPLDDGRPLAPNVLTIQVQPDEGLSLSFQIKVPGAGLRMTEARMDFHYAEAFGRSDHDAYETLLLDCMAGDPTLFIRADANEAAWKVVDPIVESWERHPSDPPAYPAGSWGPREADGLIEECGASWRNGSGG